MAQNSDGKGEEQSKSNPAPPVAEEESDRTKEKTNGSSEASKGKDAQPDTLRRQKETKVTASAPNLPAYGASIFPGPSESLSSEFTELAKSLQEKLGFDLWFLVQTHRGGNPKMSQIGREVKDSLYDSRHQLPDKEPVALLIDSPGGYADDAYQIAMLLRHACKGFVAIVPRYAKSAATLLSLGADTIIMGEHAELGPLDAQYYDPEREDIMSALDEVQALERLRAFALNSTDEVMAFLSLRSGKKLESLLPMTLTFVSDMMRPMFEQVDIVQYTKQSRVLKIAEEYASRLLQYGGLSERKAKQVARNLVEKYPHHGFFVNVDEAKSIDLPVKKAPAEISSIIDDMYTILQHEPLTCIGKLCEVNDV